jgi:Recombination endonuclease VII
MSYRDPIHKKAADKAYRMRNKEKIRHQLKAYRATHKERHNELNRASRAREWNKVASRAKNLRKYGLTLEDYERMFIEQDGVCAICKRPPQKKPLSVEHDHATGKVRGLVCWPCNFRIGAVESVLYSRILEYLGMG